MAKEKIVWSQMGNFFNQKGHQYLRLKYGNKNLKIMARIIVRHKNGTVARAGPPAAGG